MGSIDILLQSLIDHFPHFLLGSSFPFKVRQTAYTDLCLYVQDILRLSVVKI